MYVIKFYDSHVWGKNGIMVETKKYVCDSLHVIRIVSKHCIVAGMSFTDADAFTKVFYF